MIGINKGLEMIFQKCSLNIFLDEVTGDSIEKDNRIMQDIDINNEIYDCPHCGQVFSNFAEVEGHIIIEHEDIARQIVRCSECKKVLPNDEMAIKHHMLKEHIKAEQLSAVNHLPIVHGQSLKIVDEQPKENPKLEEFQEKSDESSIENNENHPYKCPICKDTFPSNTLLGKHSNQIHKIPHFRQRKQGQSELDRQIKMKDEEMKKIKSNLIRRGAKKITEIVMPKQKSIVPKSEPIMNIETNPELANCRTIDPDIKRYACTYCGNRFQMRADRAAHEKENHVDKDGNLLEITCDLCQEKVATSVHYRRHCIDKHKKHNKTLVKMEETFCCDECGKTFKVSLFFFSFINFIKGGFISMYFNISKKKLTSFK